jgi:iron complex outermembrane receptor protein
MKFLLSVSAFLLLTVGVYGQKEGGRPGGGGKERPSIGRLYGKVVNSKSNKPVEFATISLIASRSGEVENGGITDAKGRFDITEIKVGGYEIVVGFMGYETHRIKDVKLSPKGTTTKDLGTINLVQSVYALEQAEIVEEKNFMEIDIDRKVFNVDQNITSEGGSANEVLENVPSIEVDIDGKVSLRGSENVTILIDGRPSGLSGGSAEALLEQIPASSIDQVEVITNPSAAFDPDGMAGIINIVLKKNKLQGFHGNVKLSAGTSDNYSGSLGLNYRNQNFNAFVNYGFRQRNNGSWGTTSRTTTFDDVRTTLDQDEAGFRRGLSHNIKLGTDLYLAPKSTLSLSANYSPRDDSNEDSVQYSTFDLDGVLSDYFTRNSLGGGDGVSLDFDAQFRQEFSEKRHYLDVRVNRSEYSGNKLSDFEELYYDTDIFLLDTVPFSERTNTESANETWSLSADYVQPLENKGRFEAGWKSTLRSNDADFLAEAFNPLSGAYSNDTTRSNRFVFDEDVHSAYAIYGRQFDKWGMQGGLRLETVNMRSYLVNTDQEFLNNYTSLYPSGHLSYQISEGKTFQLSYSRRVNRPRSRQLNPFPNYNDPLNLRIGNPFILPEYTNSMELAYAHQWKKNTITASVYYKDVNNVIRRYKTVDTTGVSTTTYENFAGATNYGVELIAVAKLNSWWSVNGSLNGFRTIQDGSNLEGDLNADALGWSGKMMSSWKFDGGWEFQASGRYRAPRILLQGSISEMYWADFAAKKTILNKNGSIGIRVSDILNSREFNFNTEGRDFEQFSERKRQSQFVYLTFNYRFGKLEEKSGRGRGGRGEGGFDGGEGGDIGID